MFISGKVCLLAYIKVRGQTLPEINVHAHLFGTLEYLKSSLLITIRVWSRLLMHPRGVEGAHDLLANSANTNLIRPTTLETNKQSEFWSTASFA